MSLGFFKSDPPKTPRNEDRALAVGDIQLFGRPRHVQSSGYKTEISQMADFDHVATQPAWRGLSVQIDEII
jgi:hypothetical protein